MIKNIIAVAVVVALSACSSGSNDSTPANGGAQNPGTGAQNPGTGQNPGNGFPTPPVSTLPAPGGGQPPTAGTKAGTYGGTIGGGQNGVFVVRNDFSIQGLAIQADGSAQSRFGNLGAGDTFEGGLRQYAHAASQPSQASGGFGSVGGRAADDLNINVNIVNGQTIEGEAPTAVALAASSGVGASISTLGGAWIGSNQFGCDASGANCSRLNTNLTFTGASVSGSTNIEGTQGFPTIEGTITDFGGAALIDFNWGDSKGYSGLVFFVPDGSGKIAFIGERQPRIDDTFVHAVTISGLLERQTF